jgi:hypothetical protein
MKSTFYLHDIPYTSISLTTFRQTYHLPDHFGVAWFEPKDYTGLARLDSAGADMNMLRAAILQAVPDKLSPAQLPEFLNRLAVIFRVQLVAINPTIGLKPVEIDFAAAGFADVCQAFGYALIATAHRPGSTAVDYDPIYQQWLSDSIRVSTQIHSYPHGDTVWQVQVLNSVYGRIGLVIQMSAEAPPLIVYDSSLACPAENFMYLLLKAVFQQVQTALDIKTPSS